MQPKLQAGPLEQPLDASVTTRVPTIRPRTASEPGGTSTATAARIQIPNGGGRPGCQQSADLLVGHVDQEFARRAPVEGHVQPERSPFAHAGGNCTYPIGHDQGRAGGSAGRRAHQGGRREAEGVLPVPAHAVHPVRSGHPVQAVPADGLQQVQSEGESPKSYGCCVL